MASFHYRALQSNGSVSDGRLDAGSRAEALRQIEALGLRPIRVTDPAGANGSSNGSAPSRASTKALAKVPSKPLTREIARDPKSAPSPRPSGPGGGRITPRVLENFTRLLSSLLSAGVPLSRALIILNREAANPTAAAQWKRIHDLVVDGLSLADAMNRAPETFPKVYVAMVEAGEAGGFLDVVLAQIADFQAREKEMRGKVMTALLYPTILLVLAIAVLIFLLVFFIPRFQAIFSSFGGKLPLLTQMIVATSGVIRHYGVFVLLGLGIAGFFLRSWLVSSVGRRTWEGFIIRAPIVGPLVAEFAMSRFCRMLGTLLGAGVPLINSLNVARRSIGNQILVDAVSNSIERVKEGRQLGPSLGDCRALFSGSTIEMISVAEESGRLDQELVRLANTTEGDLDRELKTAVALAEPLMLGLIAAFVGAIFIGMVLPIFSLQEQIK